MIKIMVIDDSSTTIKIIETVIRSEVLQETEIYSFLSAVRAQEQFLQVAPDFVITDIAMPEIDGYELIEYIKSQCDVPVLAISGSSIDESDTGTILYCANQVGADYVMNKSDLLNKLPTLINNMTLKQTA